MTKTQLNITKLNICIFVVSPFVRCFCVGSLLGVLVLSFPFYFSDPFAEEERDGCISSTEA